MNSGFESCSISSTRSGDLREYEFPLDGIRTCLRAVLEVSPIGRRRLASPFPQAIPRDQPASLLHVGTFFILTSAEVNDHSRSALRIGGLAGFFATATLVASLGLTVAVIATAGLPQEAGPKEVLPVLLERRIFFDVINLFIVLGGVLAASLFLNLGEHLGEASRARVGTFFGAISAAFHAVGAVEVSLTRNQAAQLYAAASLDERELIAQILDATGPVAEGLLTHVPTVFFAAAMLILGWSMLTADGFGPRFGWFTLAVGVIATVSLLGPDPHLYELMLMVWMVPVALRAYRLSKPAKTRR